MSYRHWIGALLLGLPSLTVAHTQADVGAGLVAGLRHPFAGADHVLAMLAVGMWGAQLRGQAIWVLPVAFPLIMSLGAVAGILGLPLPAIEPGIILSVIALGGVIAGNIRPPLIGATAVVSVFAVFHGYAHGMELPRMAAALPYCVGFVVATGLLHLSGIAIGLITNLRGGSFFLRAGGAAIAISGMVLGGRLFVG